MVYWHGFQLMVCPELMLDRDFCSWKRLDVF